ncbi:MAG: MlaD family protein, partial [Actinomycetota bacterium]|nr:MlaD family protein [Actinomycetota bacterium]
MRTGERRKRLPNWVVGLVLIVVLAIASVYAFTKAVPWANPYTVQAVFESAGNVRPNSPVRIAGVNVGKITKIEHLEPQDAAELNAQVGTTDDPAPSTVPSTATVVTMELEESA